MECELLQKMKKINGAVNKDLRELTGEHYVVSTGIRYNIKRGELNGNTGEVMLLVSVGSEFPADISVQPRIKNPANAKKATQIQGRSSSTKGSRAIAVRDKGRACAHVLPHPVPKGHCAAAAYEVKSD